MPILSWSAAAGVVATAALSLDPNDSALPGGAVIQQLANGVGWWALIAALLGLVVGAAMWALGAHGNNYQQTAASGLAQVSVPGSTNHGSLQGGAVENSNVDLTSSLVDLITAQRNYQANAQTIKTQQTVDQTLINL